MSGNASRDYSRELQEKLEIYLLGLIFTLLAAAVQTAKFGGSAFADACELVSWVLLFVSGLVGLWRFEWIPVAHSLHGRMQDLEQGLERAEAAQQAGHADVRIGEEAMPVTDAIGLLKERRAALQKDQKPLVASTLRRYRAHKWTFVIGLALLLVARGFVPAKGVIATATAPSAATVPAVHSAASGAPAVAHASSH